MTQQLNTVIHGDCVHVLASFPAESVDFVLTDPPYLTRYRARDGRTLSNDDNDAWLRPAFAQIHRVLKRDGYCLTFYGWPHADRFMTAFRAAGFRPVGHFSFPKEYTSSVGHVRSRHETAYLLAKGDPRPITKPLADVIPWTENTGNRLHATQKPVAVLTPFVEAYCPPSGVVLDPFAGSGSSLVAATMHGRS
jgi:adenine-specific DNA-methyltransferase